jgi:hypothetical protein
MTLSRGRCPLCCGHLSTTKHSSEVPSDAPGEDHGPGARPARRPPAEDGLTRLQLTGIRDQLDNLLDEAARTNLSARETLALLCEREIARKDHRRIDMALKLAHFPAVKDLTSFDFDAQPSVDPKQIRDLAAGRWIANGENLLLLGPPGVGQEEPTPSRNRQFPKFGGIFCRKGAGIC